MKFMAKCMKSYKKYVKVSDLEFEFHICEGVKVISFDTHSGRRPFVGLDCIALPMRLRPGEYPLLDVHSSTIC
jgi:hypothetical protein